jgi:hypothetical protein
MTQSSVPSFDITLWGGKGDGKSTLMAALLCHPAVRAQFPYVDPIRSAAAIEHYQPIYRFMSQNALPAGTAKAGWFEIADTRGRTIRVRDMVGGHSGGERLDPADARCLREASAAVLVHQWPNERSRPATDAIEAALSQLPADRPKVLVFTKVERYLTRADAVAWNNGTLSPREVGLAPSAERLVDIVGRDRTFAVSVYGYQGERPASQRDEFGRIVPVNVEPFCVALPFLALWKGLP